MTTQIAREETRCRHIGYSFRLAARVLLYASSQRQDTTAFVTPVVEDWLERERAQWVHPMNDRSVHPSHHERTLLPRKSRLKFDFIIIIIIITIIIIIFIIIIIIIIIITIIIIIIINF